MKKVVPLFQKISGYIGIVVFALMFVYALGMATPSAVCTKYQDTYNFYSQINGYNNGILVLSIFGLLISSFYYVLRNNVRQVYYISNFVWYGVDFVYTIISAIVTIVGVSFYQSKYSALSFDDMNAYFVRMGDTSRINPNTPVFALGYVLAIVLLLSLIPYVFILVDKIFGRINYENNKKNGVPNPVSYVNHQSKEAK